MASALGALNVHRTDSVQPLRTRESYHRTSSSHRSGPTTHSRPPSSRPARGSPAPDSLSTSRCTAAAPVKWDRTCARMSRLCDTKLLEIKIIYRIDKTVRRQNCRNPAGLAPRPGRPPGRRRSPWAGGGVRGPEACRAALVSVVTVIDGVVITIFDGRWPPIVVSLRGVSRGRRRVKPLRGSFAALRPFG